MSGATGVGEPDQPGQKVQISDAKLFYDVIRYIAGRDATRPIQRLIMV